MHEITDNFVLYIEIIGFNRGEFNAYISKLHNR